MMVDGRIIFMTAPDQAVAENVVRTLVEEHLIACGTLIPDVRSVYHWQGRVEQSHEVLAMLKTTSARAHQTVARIAQLHPYDVPEAIVVNVTDGLPSYMAWIEQSTREVDEE